MVGAIGVALANMVGSLTLGKKKYACVEAEVIALKARADALQQALLDLVERDAEVFTPLTQAYGLPKDTAAQQAHKDGVMQRALEGACAVPVEIMERCCEGIVLCERFERIGSAIAISDVGVGVAMCRAALTGASLNVFINTRAMTDRDCAKRYDDRANALLEEGIARADSVYAAVARRLVK